MGSIVSAVGVVDKAMVLVDAVEARPRSLSELVEASGFSRATTHRLAGSLEQHGLLRRDREGRYTLGARFISLGQNAEAGFPLAEVAVPILQRLVDQTGESAQLYVRQGETRICIASVESPHGLRTIVERGAVLPLSAGSGGKALRGDVDDQKGWADSVAEREAGVASVSAPVVVADAVVGAVSVSGPIERLGNKPGRTHGQAVLDAAGELSASVTRELSH